jgi:UDP-glucose 4-epimerase
VHAVTRTQGPADPERYRWHYRDLAEWANAERLVGGVRPELILHFAGHVLGSRDLEHVLPSFRSNLMTSVNLFTAAAETGTVRRILLAGSLEEPGLHNPEEAPSSPYAVSKWAGTAYARMFHALYALPVVMLRIFMVYGPVQRDLKKLIPYVTLSLLRGEAPHLSSGERPVDWIYVDDLVAGVLAAAQAPGIEGKTVDLGSGELTTVRRVVEMLVEMIQPEIVPLIGAVPDRPMEQVRVADARRSNELLGWEAQVPLAEGLRRTVEWYRTNHAGSPTIADAAAGKTGAERKR